MAMRDRGICRQMVGVSRVVSGNERHESVDRWLDSVELQVAMIDRQVCRQMVGVSRVVSGNDRQTSL